MAEEYDVTFGKDFLKHAEGLAITNFITSMMPEEEAKVIRMIIRAFAKHGVPAQTVLDVIAELAMEGGFNDG